MASFAPESIGQIGALPITNTLLTTLIVDGVLISGSIVIARRLKQIPEILQNLVELAIESFHNLTLTIAQKRTPAIFPFVMTFFLFILTANWIGLVPGFGSIGIFAQKEGHEEFIPLLRGATSDINLTLALALVSVAATHILSLTSLGVKEYLSRFFSLNPINLFVGFLEIVSEITKIISLSFRLFGNIYAGEVVLARVSSIFAFLFPLPFLLLEVVVGFVQSLVFSILTLVFMAILTTPHHRGAKEVSHR